nr:hypothetical protein [Tanacetum cinerariifolium]
MGWLSWMFMGAFWECYYGGLTLYDDAAKQKPCYQGERKPKKGQNQMKNGKRGEAEKSQKQLQSVEEEKLKKM